MKFCTRCGSRMSDREICGACGAVGYRPAHRLPVAEYPPAGDLPTFTFTYSIPLLALIERERKVSVPFSYIDGTLLEVRSYEDAAHPVHTQLWFQHDNPLSGPCDPIIDIFPAPIERALNPVYDYAAIAAVDYLANDYTWSTTHPEIHTIRTRLPEDQSESFADSLASYLDGLCRRCLRLFGQRRGQHRTYQVGAGHGDLMR